MFIYFLGRKLCKFSVLLAPNIMIGPTIHAIASGVILNPNILRDNVLLKLHNCFVHFIQANNPWRMVFYFFYFTAPVTELLRI